MTNHSNNLEFCKDVQDFAKLYKEQPLRTQHAIKSKCLKIIKDSLNINNSDFWKDAFQDTMLYNDILLLEQEVLATEASFVYANMVKQSSDEHLNSYLNIIINILVSQSKQEQYKEFKSIWLDKMKQFSHFAEYLKKRESQMFARRFIAHNIAN